MFFRFPGPIGIIVILVLLIIVLSTVQEIMNPGSSQRSAPAPPGPTALPGLSTGPAASPPVAGPAAGGTTGVPQPPPPDPAIAIRAELQQVSQRLDDAADQTDVALNQIALWNTQIEQLRVSDDGRLIAADPKLVEQMAFLQDQPRLALQDLVTAASRIRSLSRETERLAAASPPTALAPDVQLEVEALCQTAKSAAEQWADAVEDAQAIVREARRQSPPPATGAAATAPTASTGTTSVPANTAADTPVAAATVTPSAATPQSAPAPPVASDPNPLPSVPSTATPDPGPPDPASASPVSQAIATTSPAATGDPAVPPISNPPISNPVAEPATVATEPLEEAVKRLRDQTRLEALNRRIAEEAEREGEREEKRKAAEAEAERQAEVKAERIEEARSAEVQRILQPFLTPRTIQPRLAGSSVQFRTTLDEQPMSFSALENAGALAETVNGLSTLARIGSHRDLSQPRWNFSSSPRTWSDDTRQQLRRAQDLLRRLGPTLVEEGLLSP